MTTDTTYRIACDCGSTRFRIIELVGLGATIQAGILVGRRRFLDQRISRVVCERCNADYDLETFDQSGLLD